MQGIRSILVAVTCVGLFQSLTGIWNATYAMSGERTDRPPNVVLIMADDVSWEAFGCYGGQDYETPNLDALCQRGIRFEHCYSTPLCTPSRVQLMTGKYNFRNYTHFGYLDPSQHTFGTLMRQSGYRTAIAGKWQLNGIGDRFPGWDDVRRPNHFGFDEYLLWQLTKGKGLQQGGGERYWSPVLERNGKLLTPTDNRELYGPDLMCQFLCDFIDRHKAQPFFVYYPMLLVHDPFVPTPETIGQRSREHQANDPQPRRDKQNFVAMVKYMDRLVGQIVQHVEQAGLLERTLILFTADNGTNRSIRSTWNGQTIRGGKGGTTDSGTHVPLIAFWKGHTPAGSVVDDLIDFTDFYPTLAELAGAEAAGVEAVDVDGRSFLPQLQGLPGSPRPWVLCHYQPYWGDRQPAQFVRNQRYKLYRDGRLYDVQHDLEEQHPLPVDAGSPAAQAARKMLAQAIEQFPPVPAGVGNDKSLPRTFYPDWPKINWTDTAIGEP
ncbi:MAG: sulfatase-like hydrolase/transferase [Pirellulaceae bacterium]|nr:sulfatase-like hydrolase/transferase [Pirellulaceae bacterium]